MKEYKISVITPFHNTDINMFKACVDSMLNQTIGFDNIEWIIVLHNCEQTYIDSVQAMVGQYDNVLLPILNCNVFNCSAPRNHGIRMARGKYIGFLDADDSYLLDCLEVTVRNAEETGAQIVCFRREYEKENENLMTLTETVLWNQLDERVVIEKGHLDHVRMFSGAWPFITSKVFDRRFLVDNNIYQDESIHYMAAVIYSLIALTTAERICYLPQYIGYHYYVNSKSIVQNYNKKSRTVVEYCQGIATTIDEFYKRGVDPNETLQRMIAYVSRFIIYTDMTPEDRQETRDILRPYVLKAYPIKPYKLVNAETAKAWYRIINDVVLSADDTADNKVLSEMRSGVQQLHEILGLNSHTDYGEKYHFADVDTIEDYRRLVPMTMADAYHNLINLQIGIGEYGILTSEKIDNYVQSPLGLVPFTQAHLMPYLNEMATAVKGQHSLLLSEVMPLSKMYNDDTYCETLPAIITRHFFQTMIYKPQMRDASFTMPASYYIKADDPDYKEIAQAAIADKAITQIVAPTAEHLVKFIDQVKLLCDGSVPVRQLWPSLQRIVALGAGSHSAARQYVCEVLQTEALGIKWNNGSLPLPETVVGTSTGDDTDIFLLNTTNCFYEFFRTDTEDASEPLLLSQLQPGCTYSLIITNDAGIYRLYTDFTIKVTDIVYDKVYFTLEDA